MNALAPHPVVVESGRYGRVVAARLKPNEDLVEALEQLCAAHGIAHAVVRGAIGSLVGAELARGGELAPSVVVPGPGVEILSVSGEVVVERGGGARTALSGIVADTDGQMYAGRFVRGGNRSFITIEVSLQEWIVDARSEEVLSGD
jgi:predicted DNA-binding protein with PD1-like motif